MCSVGPTQPLHRRDRFPGGGPGRPGWAVKEEASWWAWLRALGRASSKGSWRHPGGCSGLQSMESEGARVLESPGAMLWHQQQKLSKEGGPCTHLWGRKEGGGLKSGGLLQEPPCPPAEPGEKRRPTFTTSPRRALHSFKMMSKDSPGGPAVWNPSLAMQRTWVQPGWGTEDPASLDVCHSY